MSLRVRDIVAADTPAILALNLESEAVLSPMDAARYAHLLAQSAYGRVVDEDGVVVAFLLAFREGADYDSVNYRWFDAHYEAFLYVDRVVVARAHQGRGFGARLYDDLFAFARDAHVSSVTCEFDIDPPNEASRRFHARYGFAEVGTQTLPGGKRVSLQRAPG
jgi:predicted GNAT superfamily acetyltransferase